MTSRHSQPQEKKMKTKGATSEAPAPKGRSGGEGSHGKRWEIWVEGWCATGESSPASLSGFGFGATFDEAVAAYVATRPESERKHWRRGGDGVWRMWGCRAFPDEASARRVFG